MQYGTVAVRFKLYFDCESDKPLARTKIEFRVFCAPVIRDDVTKAVSAPFQSQVHA